MIGAFELMFRPWMGRKLAGMYFTGIPDALPPDRPVILASNHVSWWDGFLLREVHLRAGTAAPLYTLMREDQLQRMPLFRWMGVVGLAPQSPGSVLQALHFLRAARRRDPGCWVSVFPQGRIWPSWRRPMELQPGLRAFARVLAPAIILPVGLHLEPLNRTRPTAFVSVGQPIDVPAGDEPVSLEAVEAAMAAALQRIFAALAEHGEAAPRHWPPADADAAPVFHPTTQIEVS